MNNSKNGNQAPEDPRFAPLNARDCYYMVYAEWIEIHEPDLIAKPEEALLGQTKPGPVAIRKQDNFFINMPIPAFYLLNRIKHEQFVVKWGHQITRKMYEAATLALTPPSPSEEELAAAETPPLIDAEKQTTEPSAS